ncbi:PAN domain-containing protein [Rhizobium giardinii]|uniref:PAN domain-containing protein n=1 Tax=Rhizobium giardinii TaxID=56731 RepID=UPI003D6ECD9C
MVWFKARSNRFRVMTRAIACLLFALVSASAVFAQDASGLLDYPSTALSGLTTAQVGLSVDQCRKICTERTGCVGFDHSSSKNQCRLFGGIASAKEDSASTAATRYPVPGYREPTYEQEEETEEAAPRTFRQYVNFDLFGFDLDEGQPATTLSQCEDMCRGNLQCKAYTFNEWNQKCFQKGGVDKLRLEPRARTGVLTDELQPGYRDAQVVMEYYHGSIISGTKLGSARVAASREQCESACWGSNQCIAFSYIKSQRECRMFNFASNRFPKAGVESGSKIQPRP